MDEERRRELIRKKKRLEAKKRRHRKVIRNRIFFGMFLVVILLVVILVIVRGTGNKKVTTAESQTSSAMEETESSISEVSSAADTTESPADTVVTEGQDVYDAAKCLAAMYDYDGAIEKLESYEGYENMPAFTEAISTYTSQKDACVAADVESVPHVFFHSLLNDDRGFIAEESSDFVARDNGCWMCSVNEFNTMIQQMYDAGYVLVRLRDLVVQTTDENGNVHFEKNNSLMLPEGKKPLVMSEDDLSYYHAYENQGIASKLVLDENGDVKCEYTNASGETLVGNYDMVPLLNAFIEEHPDFSYHNAHAIIALTGYNGVFGYRTDSVYKTLDPEHLDDNQAVWLAEHPEFDYDEDVAEATKIANALKEEGWEFASHTWGHRHADTASVEDLQTDNEKWVNTVEPIVGKVDTVIFAHGSDIAGDEDYTEDNAKYSYFKSCGYNFFCNVDGSTPVWMQFRSDYVRSGRINLDGYRLYQTMIGNENSVNVMNYLGIHDIADFFDNNRIQPVEIPE